MREEKKVLIYTFTISSDIKPLNVKCSQYCCIISRDVKALYEKCKNLN